MSFWESDLGEVTGKAEDAFAKNIMGSIPDGTMASAKIESFLNGEKDGISFLVIEWLLIEGDFAGRHIRQKLHVFDHDIKKRHRALNMLKLMYQLFRISPTHKNAPSDDDLMIFTGKTAGICIRETEPNEKGNIYNWVSEVHEIKGFKCVTGIKTVIESKPSGDLGSAFSRNEKENTVLDDIPF